MIRSYSRILALTCSVLFFAGCCCIGTKTITGSGRTVTKQLNFSDFSKVRASSAFQVVITPGEKYDVVLTVDDNLVDYLEVTQSADTLRLALGPNLSVRNATLKAAVTMPQLTGLNLSGASGATVSGFTSESPFQARLSGASHLRGTITSSEVRCELSGASSADLQGSTAKLEVEASGASHANLDNYRAREAVVRASGASHVTVNASERLDAQASGASHVRYVGKPARVRADNSGASSVREN